MGVVRVSVGGGRSVCESGLSSYEHWQESS